MLRRAERGEVLSPATTTEERLTLYA
jgi:hypothetical protein